MGDALFSARRLGAVLVAILIGTSLGRSGYGSWYMYYWGTPINNGLSLHDPKLVAFWHTDTAFMTAWTLAALVYAHFRIVDAVHLQKVAFDTVEQTYLVRLSLTAVKATFYWPFWFAAECIGLARAFFEFVVSRRRQ